MSVEEQLRHDLTQALRDKDAQRAGTIRMLFASIKNKEIEERKKDVGLGDEEVIAILQKEAKKRKDSIVEFEKGNRTDLADKERAELIIIEKYLPTELSDEEILRVVRDGIRELGSPTVADFGALMKIIMPSLKGRASGDRVTRIVRAALEFS